MGVRRRNGHAVFRFRHFRRRLAAEEFGEDGSFLDLTQNGKFVAGQEDLQDMVAFWDGIIYGQCMSTEKSKNEASELSMSDCLIQILLLRSLATVVQGLSKMRVSKRFYRNQTK